MAYWLAKADDALRHDWVKRFDPRFWTLNFPRPMMAAVTTTAADALRVDLVSYSADDLAGLIWESKDVHDHPLLAYETSRDYRGLKLSFRWRGKGAIKPLDAVNGPTLTIEGRDPSGNPRHWYVRLWNYAAGTPVDAQIRLNFDALDAGFGLPADADRVWAGDIDRLFISLVSSDYSGAAQPLPAPREGAVLVEDIRCDGGGSTLALGDAFVPPHALRLASGYDDSYHLTPARILRNARQLGYAKWINHYVGMSHYFRLARDAVSGKFLAQAGAQTVNAPCRTWHRDFTARAAALGYEIIWSLSYEMFDAHAPEAWKQRAHDGAPALTGWEPPSTLLSPANAQAMAYLEATARAFVRLSKEAGYPAHFQVGEPWWWVGPDGKPCLYDTAAEAAYVAETGRALPRD